MLEYRIGKIQDADNISDMVELAIEKMNSQGILQWDEKYPIKEDFEKDILKEELYVVTLNKEIAAIYVLNKDCDEGYINGKWKGKTENYMVLHRLCVNPNLQNQGIATKIVLHIFEQVKKEGCDSIRLDVFSCNPYALTMYKSLGFEKIGEVEFRKGLFYLMEKSI